MRFPIPLEVEIPDTELTHWALATGVTEDSAPRAKDAVEALRAQVLDAVRRDFRTVGVTAVVAVKGWPEPARHRQYTDGHREAPGGSGA